MSNFKHLSTASVTGAHQRSPVAHQCERVSVSEPLKRGAHTHSPRAHEGDPHQKRWAYLGIDDVGRSTSAGNSRGGCMSASEPARQFSIVLRCPAGTVDTERRLAALLKIALRRFGFKCLLAHAEPAGPSPSLLPEEPPQRHHGAGNLPPECGERGEDECIMPTTQCRWKAAPCCTAAAPTCGAGHD